MVSDLELQHLRRCVELATEALQTGNPPFGSVLVSADGNVLFEDRNRVAETGDPTQHPEFAIARWAATNLSPQQRAAATVFTSGEHCAMCAAAHGWVGLGRVVYCSSSQQLRTWRAELGVAPGPLKSLSIQEVVPDLVVAGPVPELAAQIHELHKRFHNATKAQDR